MSLPTLAPRVLSVSPNAGVIFDPQVVFVSGENLGVNKNDVVDLVVGGRSCIDSLLYYSSRQLACVLESPDPLPAQLPDPPQGHVSVTTKLGGQSNSSIAYTFLANCGTFATKTSCQDNSPFCSWCVHGAACLTSVDPCDTGCVGDALYMTCGELVGVIVLSLALAVFIGLIIWFCVRQHRLLKIKQEYLNAGTGPSAEALDTSLNGDVMGATGVQVIRSSSSRISTGGSFHHRAQADRGSRAASYRSSYLRADDDDHGGSDSQPRRSKLSKSAKLGDESGNYEAVNEEDEDEDDEEDYLVLSHNYARKQEALEQKYAQLQSSAKGGLTSFL